MGSPEIVAALDLALTILRDVRAQIGGPDTADAASLRNLDPAALAKLVRRLRHGLRLSRATLAQRARVSPSTIKNIERGRHSASAATRLALARVLVGQEPENT